ncbi:hypothetical protein VE01_10007 [Pseudogymnoascus verrucosus]|uniref:Microbial-type PARG catalytic domain-containing protein n=1 Tax=Pseudogymnoascus verrucosus TaxID=342668 RepID=A0A1B8G8P1_9PEZI|nr:uncharacterized protein VE01_10007 [Pseudogymnoascus verrucosus]OBT92194.1 hypothetical protein VE01_10007 [Pseudogymnoascus verrucosus]
MASTSESKLGGSSPAPFRNKNWRAKNNKETIHVVIPKILKASPRAQSAITRSKMILYTPGFEPSKKVQPSESSPSNTDTPAPPRITVIQSDTFDAAIALTSSKPGARVGVLNMASSYQPGGGVLKGSIAQEESLCSRSTLYPSLRDSFYRLPTLSAIHSPDIVVFRNSELNGTAILPKAEWTFVDVISCAALKGPDVEVDAQGRKIYAREKDRETMTLKVRLILQIAREMGITRLVLGALGCGAYGNPPEEVAKIFKKVICGDSRRYGYAEGIEEIVFAIFDDGENLRVFKEVFP